MTKEHFVVAENDVDSKSVVIIGRNVVLCVVVRLMK